MSAPLIALGSLVAASALALGVRRLFVAGRKAPRVALAGKTIVVTGASPGSIGIAAARILAAWGAEVVLTTRKAPEEAARLVREAVPGAKVHAHTLDLCEPSSVRAFAAWYGAEIGDALDVLVNCAGVHLDLVAEWKAPKRTADGHEIHMRTNYLGTVHLTTLMQPYLERASRARGGARIVNVVSHLHSMGKNAELFAEMQPYHSWRAYGLSKLALMHETQRLDRALASSGVRAYSVHPGSVFSKVADKGLEEKAGLARVRRALAPIEAFILKTIDEGAQTIVLCASADALPGGAYFVDCRAVPASDELRDAEAGARLHAQTEAWLASIAP